MLLGRATGLLALLLVGLAVASCKEDKPSAPVENEVLVAAIELQGGLDKLKSGSTFSARYEGELMGTEMKGTMKHRTGAVRLEYVGPTGDPVAQVAAERKCWQRIGRAVLPCAQPIEEHTTRLARLLEASWIWPIKERADLEGKAGEGELDGKTVDTLVVRDGSGEEVGTLFLDPKTTLVVGLQMQTTLMGREGKLVGRFSGHEENCGIEAPTKRRYTFDGQPFLKEKIGGVICEDVEEKVFDRPPQVEHGFVELKHKTASTVACTKLKGPYDGVQAALDKVSEFIASKEIPQTGPAVLIHHKGPPRTKRPEAFVTDVCLTVGKKAWAMPKGTWEGDFFVKEIIADEILAAYGIGDHIKTSTELPEVLLRAAKKRKRPQVGPLVQILYTPPGDFPPEQRVSEMHATLK
jgi:effector-binding domain-containing protein